MSVFIWILDFGSRSASRAYEARDVRVVVVVEAVELVFVEAVVAATVAITVAPVVDEELPEDEVVPVVELFSASSAEAAVVVELEPEGPLMPRKAEPTSTPMATVAEIATLIFVYVFAAISFLQYRHVPRPGC